MAFSLYLAFMLASKALRIFDINEYLTLLHNVKSGSNLNNLWLTIQTLVT
jgi:hypothetical protein